MEPVPHGPEPAGSPTHRAHGLAIRAASSHVASLLDPHPGDIARPTERRPAYGGAALGRRTEWATRLAEAAKQHDHSARRGAGAVQVSRRSLSVGQHLPPRHRRGAQRNGCTPRRPSPSACGPVGDVLGIADVMVSAAPLPIEMQEIDTAHARTPVERGTGGRVGNLTPKSVTWLADCRPLTPLGWRQHSTTGDHRTMHQLTTEERACPRCGIRRTTRLWRSHTSFCFNCRLQWDRSARGLGPDR